MRKSLRRLSRGTAASLASTSAGTDADADGKSTSRTFGSSMDADTDAPVLEAFLDGPAINKKAVVGIDFGTTNSGFAYALTSERRIHVVRHKEPTCVLFKKETHELVEFGIDARNFYRKAQAGQELLTKFSAAEHAPWEDDYDYFDQDIKMQLFEERKDLERQKKRAAREHAREHAGRVKTSKGDRDRGDRGGHRDSGGEDDPEEAARREGASITYFHVIAAILGKMKDTAMRKMRGNKHLKGPLEVADVLWVVTVPSMWRESDKQIMRRAAHRAGLTRDEFSGDLVIALESECAAVWAEVLFEHKRFGKDARLTHGDVLLCLDAGGGTVDISAIRVDRTHREGTNELELSMQQLLAPTGLKLGSQDVDLQFHKFLRQLLGSDNFDRVWAQADARMELQDGWEKLKTSLKIEDFDVHHHPARERAGLGDDGGFELDRTESNRRRGKKKDKDKDKVNKSSKTKPKFLSMHITMTELNVHLHDLVTQFNRASAAKYGVRSIQVGHKKSRTRHSTVLVVPPRLLHYCFDDVVNSIVHKARHVLDVQLAGRRVDHLVLYGGLGSSDYLRHVVHEAFKGETTVHCPRHARLAVMKGAVKYGMFPKIISSRRARMTVGVKTVVTFDRNKHNKKPHMVHKAYDGSRKAYFLRDVFKAFVHRGELVDVNQVYKHTFAPASATRDTIKFDVYASSNPDVAYITEEGCTRLARIVLPIEKGSMRNVTLGLNFGFTELRAHVLNDKGMSVKEVPIVYDRMGEAQVEEEDLEFDHDLQDNAPHL